MRLSGLNLRFPVFAGLSISRKWAFQYSGDIIIGVFLAVGIGFAAYYLATLIDPAIFGYEAHHLWFNSDFSSVFTGLMDHVNYGQEQVNLPPLFLLLAYIPSLVFQKALDIEPLSTLRLICTGFAVLWCGLLFLLLRLLGCPRLDSALYTVLGASSAAAIFWFSVPEIYSLGSLALLLVLLLAALPGFSKVPFIFNVLINTLVISFSVPHGIFGILATHVSVRWRKGLQITAISVGLAAVLWALKIVVFNGSYWAGGGQQPMFWGSLGAAHLLQVCQVFFISTMVMPTINLLKGGQSFEEWGWPLLSVQASALGKGSIWEPVAIWLWLALIGLGVWALVSIRQHPKLRLVLGLGLLGQLILYLLYGRETFLFAAYFLPLLIVLAALSSLTPRRPLAVLLAVLLVLTAGMNNRVQFNQAIAVVQTNGPQRHQVQAQMRLRPSEPWPRGEGHVILGEPGSLQVDKAYHEPGGSFSPVVGSFGVAFWLKDSSGSLTFTSDTIPLNEIDQQFFWNALDALPGIRTQTSYYQTLWQAPEPQKWTLDFQHSHNSEVQPMLVIRSVGPAGSPIHTLNWNGEQLLINDRWSVTMTPTPKVYLGEEGQAGWMSDRSSVTQWQGENGWGYARLELDTPQDFHVDIQDLVDSSPMSASIPAATQADFIMDLPGQQFVDSLNAQIAHIKMGLVGQETRPGDPTNYPLTWQRDGAYVVVALARAGQVETAKALSMHFAENDFFGGFGAEADAPGLSIWALQEVSARLNQPEYDELIWPHVRRKAEFILKMMTTTEPIYQPFSGPVVPKHQKDPELNLVAEPARDGLIIGRMDHHRPLLFVNAVSYRGLLDAAALAEKLNQAEEAQRWRTRATQLQQSWLEAFNSPEAENDRTFISSMWPTWVVAPEKEQFNQALQARWDYLRDEQGGFRNLPLWTYFDIAEAHQWLLLDHPEQVWSTLNWFWQNQASPGLYSWWEGNGEENTFRLWDHIRGWVKPPHVTPHYWTAAEMLLLQLDMLAYTDLSATEPTVVIGSGIPKNWLSQPIAVKGLSMPFGTLDWAWDGEQMQVTISGTPVNVRLGSNFPTNAPLTVEQETS